MTECLTLGALPGRGIQPGPDRPTIILPGRWNPLQFEDVPALARWIQRRRQGRGLVIQRRTVAYHASDSFPGFTIAWERDGDEQYAFTVAIQTDRREVLEAALAEANPDLPETP
jgi:hypothetical protein